MRCVQACGQPPRRPGDLAVGAPPHWAVEGKLARVERDNGTYEDAAIK